MVPSKQATKFHKTKASLKKGQSNNSKGDWGLQRGHRLKPKEAYSYFERTRHQPLGSGGGTDFTAALVEAYDTIAAHEKIGGEVQRANILVDRRAPIDSLNERLGKNVGTFALS
ncbi:MAG: hypothetical protein ABIQ95_13160 [Bdellovibrionia bacterium]